MKKSNYRGGRLGVVSLLVVALLSSAGCGRKDVSGYLAEARQYQQKGDSKAAVIQLKNALQKDPNNGEARYFLGTIYVETGDPKSAEKEFRKALELNFDAARVMPALGRSLLLQGEFRKVLDEITPEKANDPGGSAEILALRGKAGLGLGLVAEAGKDFALALQLHPGDVGALLGQAQLALSEKDIGRAESLVGEILEKSPDSADAWLFKGDLQRMRKDDEAALESYGRAIKAQPENINARIGRAAIRLDQNKLDAARTDIEAVRKIAPGSLIGAYMQALLDYHNQRHAAAWETLQQILRSAPDHMPSLLLAGMVEYAQGSMQQAEQHLARFLDKNPQHLLARKLMIAVLLKNDNPRRAEEILQVGLKQAPKDNQLLALAGDVYVQSREMDKSSDYLEKAVAGQPNNSGLRSKLGMSLLAQGETDQAIASLEAAVKLDPADIKAETALTMSYLGKGQFDQALRVAQNLEKKRPDHPDTYNLMGAAYIGKKDMANARKSFEYALQLKPDYFPTLMNLAQLDLQAKDAATARKRFETILAKDPKHLEAMMALANVENALGNIGQSVGWLEKAAKDHPTALAPRVTLTKYYLQIKEPKKALAVAAEANAAKPNQAQLLDLLGQAQFAGGDGDAASATYANLVALFPKSHEAHYRMATMQIAGKNYPAAADSLKTALKLKPDYLDAEAAFVYLEMRQGHPKEASAIAQRIQKQFPQRPDGAALEGDVLMSQKDYAQAAKAYEKAYALAGNGPLAIRLHQSLMLAGNPKGAETRIQHWLQTHPDDIAVRFYLAGFHQKTGQAKPEAEQYRLILQKNPDNLVAINNLAALYQREKDPRALEYAERAYKLRPDSGAIADTLGWILIEAGKTQRGLELMQKAANLSPQDPEIRYHLAAAWAKSGEKTKARKELEVLLGKDGPFSKRAEAQALLDRL